MELDMLLKKLMLKVVEATILSGKSKGEDVLISRLPVIPTDMPFEFKRLQFYVRLAFSITINKAQVQSLQCQLNPGNQWFAHWQLYVCMFASGKFHKIIHFCARQKSNKYCVCHSTSINNYLQNTQQNIYFFKWHGNVCCTLASVYIYIWCSETIRSN